MRKLLMPLFIVLLGACSTPPESKSTINHLVLVWFKDSASKTEIAQVRAHSLALRSIPGLLAIQAGSAVPSKRPIVDDSFDLGLVMSFASIEAMNAYLVHPRHKAFVEKHIKGRVERLLVYDIQTDSP